jgi:hypothetical protein
MSVAGLEPARHKPTHFLTTIVFTTNHKDCLWSGAHLNHIQKGVRFPPSALYTFKISLAWLGIAISKKDLGFPEFDGLHP